MTTSERPVLIYHIVADAMETVLKEDKSYRASFIRTNCLVEFTKSDNNDLIKP